MQFQKYISVILHPIVIPTVGVMVYFLMVPNNYLKEQKFTILSYIFLLTYLIPLFTLLLLKRIKLIKTYKTESIKERKLPVVLMFFLFYFLATSFQTYSSLKDLTILFYGTSLGLLLIFLLFYLKVKTSIHMLSLGVATGFFLVLTQVYDQSFLLIIMVCIFLAGLLGSSRLKLQAHSPLEVYTGFFLGILSTLTMYFVL